MQLEATSRPLLGIPERIPFVVHADCELVSIQPRELFAPILESPGMLAETKKKGTRYLVALLRCWAKSHLKFLGFTMI